MGVFWLFFKIQLLTIYRGILSGGSKRRLLLLAPVGILPYFTFTASLNLFRSWILSENIGQRLHENFLSSTLLGFFIFLSFGGIPIALHQFSKAKDLQILLSKPISRRLYFLYKFFLTSLYNSPLFFFIGLPVLFACLYSAHVSPLLYALVVFAVLLFVQFPTFIATAIALFFLKLTSFNKAKNVATALVGVVFIAGWAGFQFLRLSSLNPGSADFDPQQLQRLANIEWWDFLPSHLMANFIILLASGEILSFLFKGLLLLIGALFFINAGAMLADIANRKDWITSGIKSGSRVGAGSGNKLSMFPSDSPVLTLLKKDLLLFWRDSRQTTSILMLVVMLIVFPFLVQTHNTDYGQFPPFGFVALFSSVIAANISSRTIPFEGLAFRLNLVCPQPIYNIYVAKMLAAFLLTIGPAFFGLIIFAWRFSLDWPLCLLSAFMVIGVILNATSIGMWMGIKYANFKWENPKQLLLQPGAFYLILLALFVTLVGLAIILPTYFILSSYLAILFFVAFSGGLQFLFLKLSLKRLTKLEWHF